MVKKEASNQKSISVIVQELIEEGARLRASDVHFSPQSNGLRVRMRVDGLLEDKVVIPKEKQGEIIAHLKVLARLRSDQHFKPQDGRFAFSAKDGRCIDIRLSTVSTYFGENAVLRLLQTTEENLSLTALGFSATDLLKIMKVLTFHSGMVLVTGPTGSGKTTTLYTLLKMVSQDSVSLVTLEDPIEYSLPNVTQMEIHPQAGITFPYALRSVLRQDPDIIMVGEIRDEETARISIHAALTGHLVFSTLHTTDASSVLPRLIDMGIEPYLIASTVKLIISQRLIRKKCGNEFFGRTVIAEVLEVTDKISDSVLVKSSQRAIRELAIKEGMTDIASDGFKKVEEGVTTREEVLRMIHE